jgi:hypothetical protein
MPTLLAQRKATSGSDRYGEVVLESPESLARGMLPKRLAGNPRELPISSHTKRNASYIREVRDPEGRPEGSRRDVEQSYDPIVPVKVGNRRASVRSGHGTHWREGGNKQRI